jgi:1-deoxy-D-xylulose-5-phosphate reductoisomerase
MSKNIIIFGATGSIGSSVLKLLDRTNGEFCLKGITCNENIKSLSEISNHHNCNNLGVSNKDLSNSKNEILMKKNTVYGIENFDSFINDDIDIYILAISGLSGASLALKIAETGKTLAIANKECIISLGKILINKCREFKTSIFPLDSEHNAIHQLLHKNPKSIKNITLTASGGPFLDLDLDKFDFITPKQAIKHPKWEMGKKISIDSSNMMNKSLELIEAKNLFHFRSDQVNAIVHPQSIIHGILNYHDNSSYAFLSQPNMEIPISSLFFPNKDFRSNDHDLDLTKLDSLEFFEIDNERFPAFKLGKYIMQKDGIAPHLFNYVNDKLVRLFLDGAINYTKIVNFNEKIIELYFKSHKNLNELNIEDLYESNNWVDENLKAIINK